MEKVAAVGISHHYVLYQAVSGLRAVEKAVAVDKSVFENGCDPRAWTGVADQHYPCCPRQL